MEEQIELFPYYEIEHKDKLPTPKRMIELLRKVQKSENKEIVIDYLIAYIYFLNFVIPRANEVKVCNDKWYRFGQLSKSNKIKKIVNHLLKNYLVVKRLNNE